MSHPSIQSLRRFSLRSRVFLLFLGIGPGSGCGDPEPIPDGYEDPPPPAGPMVPFRPPPLDFNPLEMVCESFNTQVEAEVPREELMVKTAAHAINRGGAVLRVYTERWGALLPPELYFDVKLAASGLPVCDPFVAFLKKNAEDTQDLVRAYREEQAAKRAARAAAAQDATKEAAAAPVDPDQALQSIPGGLQGIPQFPSAREPTEMPSP